MGYINPVFSNNPLPGDAQFIGQPVSRILYRSGDQFIRQYVSRKLDGSIRPVY